MGNFTEEQVREFGTKLISEMMQQAVGLGMDVIDISLTNVTKTNNIFTVSPSKVLYEALLTCEIVPFAEAATQASWAAFDTFQVLVDSSYGG